MRKTSFRSLDALCATLAAALGVSLPSCASSGEGPIVTGNAGGSGGSTASGTGGSAGTGGTISGSGGSPGASRFPCVSPQPILIDGKDTGIDKCGDSGMLRRRAAVECPSHLPRATAVERCVQADAGPAIACTFDSQCTQFPEGYCA